MLEKRLSGRRLGASTSATAPAESVCVLCSNNDTPCQTSQWASVCRHMHKLMAKLRLLTHAARPEVAGELNSARCQANDPRLKYQLTRHTPRSPTLLCYVRLTYCVQKRMMTQSADSISPRGQRIVGKLNVMESISRSGPPWRRK